MTMKQGIDICAAAITAPMYFSVALYYSIRILQLVQMISMYISHNAYLYFICYSPTQTK